MIHTSRHAGGDRRALAQAPMLSSPPQENPEETGDPCGTRHKLTLLDGLGASALPITGACFTLCGKPLKSTEEVRTYWSKPPTFRNSG
jgi:hypothetical protein